MSHRFLSVGSAALLASFVLAAGAQAAVINVDLNGHRNSEPAAVTYHGPGRLSGADGTFNGISVEQDNPIIPLTPLVDDAGNPSSVTLFSTYVPSGTGGSGGDNPTNSASVAANDPAALLNDYLFTSGGDAVTFTFGGFVANTPVSLYVYHSNASSINASGAAAFSAAVDTGATGAFENRVFVYSGNASAAGTVSAVVNVDLNIINGLTITGDTLPVPEPTMLGLLALPAAVGLLTRRGR